ncbi:hypothetical protein RKD20_000079 [Streptomyces sp. SLBN-8D4]
MTLSFRTTDVTGYRVSYRETGELGAPKLALLGGLPPSSHQ